MTYSASNKSIHACHPLITLPLSGGTHPFWPPPRGLLSSRKHPHWTPTDGLDPIVLLHAGRGHYGSRGGPRYDGRFGDCFCCEWRSKEKASAKCVALGRSDGIFIFESMLLEYLLVSEKHPGIRVPFRVMGNVQRIFQVMFYRRVNAVWVQMTVQD